MWLLFSPVTADFIFKIMIQEILAFALLGAAVFFIGRKFFFKSKKKSGKDCGNGDCGCN